MLNKTWFITEITEISIRPVKNRGTNKAFITVYYGILGLRGFRVYQKEKDGKLLTWVKAPCFSKKLYSEVPSLSRKKYKDLWFEWMNTIKDVYLEWLEKNQEEITNNNLDKITKKIKTTRIRII